MVSAKNPTKAAQQIYKTALLLAFTSLDNHRKEKLWWNGSALRDWKIRIEVRLTGSFLKNTNDVRVRINQRLFQDFQPIPEGPFNTKQFQTPPNEHPKNKIILKDHRCTSLDSLDRDEHSTSGKSVSVYSQNVLEAVDTYFVLIHLANKR